jgi:hypothetical protein
MSPDLTIMMKWDPKKMQYYGKIKPFIDNMMYLKFEFWAFKADGEKELLSKTKLLNTKYDNLLITKKII